ncbi:MAG: hypothetical protein JRH14_11135, partial [Deltaproteobacteria bacterium]|nr:hypothetical protein [Deltaproteobacteria bacterium]
VDPIDGTRAFVRGLPTWSVLVGIEADGVPVAGIAYMPAAGDLFAAVQGHGTTHNGVPVHVSKLSPLADATVTHGCLQQFTDSGVGEALVRLAGACDSARGYPDFDGYRQVLLGRSDAMVDPGVQPYDICAPRSTAAAPSRATASSMTNWSQLCRQLLTNNRSNHPTHVTACFRARLAEGSCARTSGEKYDETSTASRCHRSGGHGQRHHGALRKRRSRRGDARHRAPRAER